MISSLKESKNIFLFRILSPYLVGLLIDLISLIIPQIINGFILAIISILFLLYWFYIGSENSDYKFFPVYINYNLLSFLLLNSYLMSYRRGKTTFLSQRYFTPVNGLSGLIINFISSFFTDQRYIWQLFPVSFLLMSIAFTLGYFYKRRG